MPLALFVFALLYGGLVCIAGVLGTKLASLGTWPVLGPLAVEAGIFAFLILVVLSSAVAELYGRGHRQQAGPLRLHPADRVDAADPVRHPYRPAGGVLGQAAPDSRRSSARARG